MPKIEVNEKLFFSLVGRAYAPAELEEVLPGAKAELERMGSARRRDAPAARAPRTASSRLS